MKIRNWKLSHYRTIYGSFRSMYDQWELPLAGVFHQLRFAYLFTQWGKSIRNLNKSLLKHHWDSQSRSASNSSFLSLPSHPSSWLHSVNCWTVLSLFLFIFLQEHSRSCFVLHYSSEAMEGKKAAAVGWVHPTMPVSNPSKELGKISSYCYGLYLLSPGKLASTLISKSDFNCIKIWLQPRTPASPNASTILLKSPAQNHPVLPCK